MQAVSIKVKPRYLISFIENLHFYAQVQPGITHALKDCFQAIVQVIYRVFSRYNAVEICRHSRWYPPFVGRKPGQYLRQTATYWIGNDHDGCWLLATSGILGPLPSQCMHWLDSALRNKCCHWDWWRYLQDSAAVNSRHPMQHSARWGSQHECVYCHSLSSDQRTAPPTRKVVRWPNSHCPPDALAHGPKGVRVHTVLDDFGQKTC